MTSKPMKEWFVEAVWGKIAMVSWGNPDNPPIFLLHGYMDTAATFTFLVDKLPDKYYFVAIDMPGHGKSDPFPPGVVYSKVHVIEAMRVAVDFMKWKSFIFLSHSMGCIIGSCYNASFPGQIEKIILLDPSPALTWYYITDKHSDLWYKGIYSFYYENYKKWNFDKPQSRSYESWIQSMSRARRLTEEQCKILLSRLLIPTENNEYELSFEPRAKVLAHINLPMHTLFYIMSLQTPTLIVHASVFTEFNKVPGSRTFAENLVRTLQETSQSFHQVTVNGYHDFHITNPEPIAECIEEFLETCQVKSETSQKSKL